MTTSIPKTADLAAALVAHAGANATDSMLLAALIVDEVGRANAAGAPRPMLDFVENAKATFPTMFAPTVKAAEVPVVPVNETVTARVARLHRETSVQPTPADPWASAPITAKVLREAGKI